MNCTYGRNTVRPLEWYFWAKLRDGLNINCVATPLACGLSISARYNPASHKGDTNLVITDIVLPFLHVTIHNEWAK